MNSFNCFAVARLPGTPICAEQANVADTVLSAGVRATGKVDVDWCVRCDSGLKVFKTL
jgi:hypothetical protein